VKRRNKIIIFGLLLLVAGGLARNTANFTVEEIASEIAELINP
jgi:hypothetical protein